MGMIKYKDRLKQLFDYEGIGKGNASPTDIDAVLEFDNKFLFLFEIKLEEVANEKGKIIALKRIADAWSSKSNESISMIIFCEHNVPANKTVTLKDLTVVLYYFDGSYIDVTSPLSDFLYTIKDFYQLDKLMP